MCVGGGQFSCSSLVDLSIYNQYYDEAGLKAEVGFVAPIVGFCVPCFVVQSVVSFLVLQSA